MKNNSDSKFSLGLTKMGTLSRNSSTSNKYFIYVNDENKSAHSDSDT